MREGAVAGFVRNVLAMAWREGTVMRHDRAFVAVVTVQPLMMLLLFGLALSNEPHDVPWAVLDRSQSAVSRRLVAEIEATGRFLPVARVASYDEGRERLRNGRALVVLVIPSDLRRDLARGDPEVQLLVDGSDPLSAARVAGIVRGAALRLGPAPEVRTVEPLPGAQEGPIALRQRFWFNPTLADRDFFLAALAGMLLTNLCLSATALGLVAERETGTYEQTLSLPTRPIEMVIGKLLPYAGMSYVVLALAVVGSGVGFGVWPQGSVLALLVLTLPFVLASLAIGVLVSALSRTSAQAVFLTVFFILPSFVMSGVMFPYQLMPPGIRELGAVLPLRWYQIGLRRVVSRGGDLGDVIGPTLVLFLIFGILLALIRWRLRPRLG